MPTKARQAKIDHAQKHKIAAVRVVLEDLHDPHNAGAILRTVEGLGAGSVWYLFDKEEAYNPKEIGKRSSAIANKWVETKVFTHRAELEEALQEGGFESYAC